MKRIVAGVVAHVDAGKTTLSEALLYRGGTQRQLGRVDNGDSFLDPDTLEKQRGITIFSHQASITYNNLNLTLLDTPGHVDFAGQTEQVLPVLDYAILVISATDGIQGSTRTLWRLLKKYQVPTFIFINKTDVMGTNPHKVIQELQTEFSSACLPFTEPLTADRIEAIAMTDDDVLNDYLDSGNLKDETIRQLIARRKVFPIYSGAALKLTGVDDFITGFSKWTIEAPFSPDFQARVFKISHDNKGERLTWVRVLGGTLKAKAEILPDEKANQLRVYNGAKFTVNQAIPVGGVGAITGLTSTFPGQGLGNAKDQPLNEIQPVLSYAVKLNGVDPHKCLLALRELEDEEPHLNVQWSAHLQEIHLQIIGEVQLEIIQQLLHQRYGIDIEFNEGNILYKETIASRVIGIGHFEPLRHYAEVHLLLEPGKTGSGLQFNSDCSVDILSHNWQEQIMTSLHNKEHRGVLIGAPLTDTKITLINGRGSIVHSVGGDFREATYRAVRQGLMMLKQTGQCKLLEPWYQFRLTIDQEHVGRAINDIQQMDGTFKLNNDNSSSSTTVITGTAPVTEMRKYAQTVRAYTHGQGQLELTVMGYQECHNASEIIANANYNPTADLANTPDSVFCAHGAGYPVKWNQVPTMAHVQD
ncbi:TetM/TetW/TetO/TetS family tetracycline resistance ribosomal protection protein [Limosilactobacillus sp. Sa3CUN2]|uniref:TetM/TetW/TetO/TetS family tetracycline resistance ribosomal protection protein n=1 Tax=Limosilactobacillus avistercoris TaxID=2762243 RepID=A0ABR8PCC9_9LACO|nr:TetM/TetW/TetO/TetS family tetracycline resistance ribosomal protection protein [Limosilactobacillus avistercoris]MBD7894893.1 TetM/TetW/TetO/TetS family tetracycline resistance ribosomal protection protein [Limosilactobacillus avistercoris]